MNHMWGCSLLGNLHFGAIASQPHLRCAIAPPQHTRALTTPTLVLGARGAHAVLCRSCG